MAQEKPNRLAEWLTIAKQNAPVAKRHFSEWWEEVRADPGLAWETYWVRYPVYALCGLVVLLMVNTGITLFAPPMPPKAQAVAGSADFRVVCTETACGHQFVINREFGFNDFPVTCTKCRKLSGYSARPCYSTTCNGRWVAPVQRDDGPHCPSCAAKMP